MQGDDIGIGEQFEQGQRPGSEFGRAHRVGDTGIAVHNPAAHPLEGARNGHPHIAQPDDTHGKAFQSRHVGCQHAGPGGGIFAAANLPARPADASKKHQRASERVLRQG